MCNGLLVRLNGVKKTKNVFLFNQHEKKIFSILIVIYYKLPDLAGVSVEMRREKKYMTIIIKNRQKLKTANCK